MHQFFIFLIISFCFSSYSMSMDLVSIDKASAFISDKEVEARFNAYVPFKSREKIISFKNNETKEKKCFLECLKILKENNKDVAGHIAYLIFKVDVYDKCHERFFKINSILKGGNKPFFGEAELSALDICKMHVSHQDTFIAKYGKNWAQKFVMGYNPNEIVFEKDEQVIIDIFPEEKRKDLKLKVAKGCFTGRFCRWMPLMIIGPGLVLGTGFSIAGAVLLNPGLGIGGIAIDGASIIFGAMIRWANGDNIEAVAEIVSYDDNDN